jgi:hypothetical protein
LWKSDAIDSKLVTLGEVVPNRVEPSIVEMIQRGIGYASYAVVRTVPIALNRTRAKMAAVSAAFNDKGSALRRTGLTALIRDVAWQ